MRQLLISVVICGFFTSASALLYGGASPVYYDPGQVKAFGADYPKKIETLANELEKEPRGFGIPYQDRRFWDQFEKTPQGKELIRIAEEYLQKPQPVVTEQLYMDFFVTGRRDPCQTVIFARKDRFSGLCLAECVENKGRFIRAFEEILTSLCNDPSWVYPAHDSNKENYLQKKITVDLKAAADAHDIALALYLLNDKLNPALVRLAKEKLHEKIFKPYMDDIYHNTGQAYWKTATHNWNAVCHAGVTGAALTTLENKMDRALFIDRAVCGIENFYRGFTPDGYCSEGLGYWNYGYGHYILLSEVIYCATGGKRDLFADPRGLPAAMYPFRVEIINGVYPALADSSPSVKPAPEMMGYINARLNLEDSRWSVVEGLDKRSRNSLFYFLMPQYRDRPVVEPPFQPDGGSVRTWFADAGVLICRPANRGNGFAAVLKGGHNAEHHNHNDVGSFIVVLDDQQVIIDPGSVEYTSKTFSKERYTIKKLSSYGHDVPRVAGLEQMPGRNAEAKILRTNFTDEQDSLMMDLASAYPVKQLEKLHRSFVYSRKDRGWLEVTDEVEFSEPNVFETALITYGSCKKIDPKTLEITAGSQTLRVELQTGDTSIEIADEIIESTKGSPLRIAIRFAEPVKKGRITMRISPK
jgi:hypothetical protein